MNPKMTIKITQQKTEELEKEIEKRTLRKKCYVEDCQNNAEYYFPVSNIYKFRFCYCKEHSKSMVKQKAFRKEPIKLPKREMKLTKSRDRNLKVLQAQLSLLKEIESEIKCQECGRTDCLNIICHADLEVIKQGIEAEVRQEVCDEVSKKVLLDWKGQNEFVDWFKDKISKGKEK